MDHHLLERFFDQMESLPLPAHDFKPSPSATLACRGLVRRLGTGDSVTMALKGVSLQTFPGLTYAIVGPSGCGKSTLLYLLGLLDQPDEGSIWIGGLPASELSDWEATAMRNHVLGFVFQFHFLIKEFSAAENVMLPMWQAGVADRVSMRERAWFLLDRVGLADKANRRVSQLSGGEQQRVAIARALANHPRLVLADEPTGNLDTANSERAFELLQEVVREEGATLLLVTHNPEIAAASDEVFQMQDGVLVGHYRK